MPGGIATLEAFGAVTVTPGGVSILPASIPSAEAFGTAQLNLLLSAPGIETAEAFDAPSLHTGVTMTVAGIDSLESFGNLTIQPGGVIIAPTGISSGELLGLLLIGPRLAALVRVTLRASMESPILSAPMRRLILKAKATGMTPKTIHLRDLAIGDDTPIEFELSDWPDDAVLAKAYLTIKASKNDADAAAIIQRSITTIGTDQGQITADGSTGTARGYFMIAKDEFDSIRPRQTYFYDIQPILDSGDVRTPIDGTITFKKGVTDASV